MSAVSVLIVHEFNQFFLLGLVFNNFSGKRDVLALDLESLPILSILKGDVSGILDSVGSFAELDHTDVNLKVSKWQRDHIWVKGVLAGFSKSNLKLVSLGCRLLIDPEEGLVMNRV